MDIPAHYKIHTGRLLVKVLFYAFMLVLVLYYFFPMIWMVYSSFKNNITIFQSPFSLPEEFSFKNWSEAWRIGRIGDYAKNSVFITSVSVTCILLFSSAAAYAFARLQFRGRQLLFGCMVVGLFIPVQSYFIAQNSIIRWMGFTDTYLGLIFPYIAMELPLATYILQVYFSSIPAEVEESAIIDGANRWAIYRRIMLPMVGPGMATAGVFTVISVWNEFLLAMLYIQNPDLKTLTVGMFAFSGQYKTNYAQLFSGLSIITIPMIAVYFLFNKRIVAGMVEGAVKG